MDTTLDTRTAPVLRRLWLAPALGLVATVAAGLWEHGPASRYSATTTGTVTAITRAQRACSRCDRTPPRIAYTAGGETHTVVIPRSVVDGFRFDRVGAPVPLRYDPQHPGRAVIDRPWYRYPVSAALAVLTALVAALVAWLATAGRGRLARQLDGQARLRQPRRAPLAARPNRRRMLAAVDRSLALGAFGLVLVLVGSAGGQPAPAIAGFALVVAGVYRASRTARCPHCGAPLRPALTAMAPLAQPDLPGHGLNVLLLRKALTSGAPIECTACGRELDRAARSDS